MIESREICACRQRCSEAEPLLATIYKKPQPLIDNTTNDSWSHKHILLALPLNRRDYPYLFTLSANVEIT